eukprot:10936305-Ditylum_brightwellii.AAC.1
MYDVSNGTWSQGTTIDNDDEKVKRDGDNGQRQQSDLSSCSTVSVPVGEDILVESHCRNNE